MTRKIKISVLKEEYLFKLSLFMGEKRCTLRQYCKEEQMPCTIEGNHIVLETPITLKGKDWETEKEIKKIKIPKEYLKQIQEYIKL
jgi:hypothetical protein